MRSISGVWITEKIKSDSRKPVIRAIKFKRRSDKWRGNTFSLRTTHPLNPIFSR
jgi:hypothetical protein